MLRIIAVGRLAASAPEARLFARYAIRIRPKLDLVELADARGSLAETRCREAAKLLSALPPRAFAVALDAGGSSVDSVELARLLSRWLATGRAVCFLIGGAEGLDRTVLDRADAVLSLGPLTWPHLLVRAMLAEQLYRARSIATGHPYHRTTRP